MSNQSNTMPQPMRISEFIRYNFTDQRDWMNYKVVGRKFYFELYPAMGSGGFPTIKFEHEPFKLQNSSPLIYAFRTWSEFNGKTYQVVALFFSDGTFSKLETALRVYAFQDGKQVHMVTFPGGIWDFQAAMSVLLDMDYQANAKDIPQSKIKTIVGNLNEDDFTRTFTASISADGLPILEKSGDAIALRKSGIDLKTFQYFRWAKVWEIQNWKVIICERYDGAIEYVLHDENGQRPEHGAGNVPTLILALVCAFELWRSMPKTK